MELQELLALYQATSATAGRKERAYWSMIGAVLLSNAVLLAVGAFFVSASWLEEWKKLTSAVAGLGLVLTLYWAIIQFRLSKELALWHGLLRHLEGEFAGIELHRSAFRFQVGQGVRVPSTSLHCEEWYSQFVYANRVGRMCGRWFKGILPGVFFITWVLLGLFPWICG